MDEHRDDIRRYVQGKMSPSERHDLERQALEDPFLAEALEGAQSISPENFDDDLQNVRRQVLRTTKKASLERRKHWYYGIAASLLLLLGIASVIVLQTPSRNTATDLALKQESPAEAPASATEQYDDGDATAQSSPVVEEPERLQETIHHNEHEEAGPSSEKDTDPATPSAEQQNRVDNREIIAPDKAARSAASPRLHVGDSIATEAIDAAPAAAQRSKDANAAEKKRDQDSGRAAGVRSELDFGEQASRTITGTVTDAEDGIPLPGVSVVSSEGTGGTITDINGNFELPVSTDAKSLTFSFVGMQALEMPLSVHPEPLEVKLTEDVSQLSEVVVTGYGNEDDVSMENIHWEYAEPDGGRKAYKEYLEKNLRYPEKALENEVEGKVSVQFTIEPSGVLSEFKVIRSLGYGCDEEVMRLIRQGPGWNPTKRDDRPVKSRGKVKMRFALQPNKK